MQSRPAVWNSASGLSGTVCLSRDQMYNGHGRRGEGAVRVAWLQRTLTSLRGIARDPARIILMKLELSWLRSFRTGLIPLRQWFTRIALSPAVVAVAAAPR